MASGPIRPGHHDQMLVAIRLPDQFTITGLAEVTIIDLWCQPHWRDDITAMIFIPVDRPAMIMITQMEIRKLMGADLVSFSNQGGIPGPLFRKSIV